MRQAMIEAARRNPGDVADWILKSAPPAKTNGWKVDRRSNGRRSK